MLSAFWRICDLANEMSLRNHNHGTSHVSFNNHESFIRIQYIVRGIYKVLWEDCLRFVCKGSFPHNMQWFFIKVLYICQNQRFIYHYNYNVIYLKLPIIKICKLYNKFMTKSKFLKENDLSCFYNLHSRPNMRFWGWSNTSPWFPDEDKVLMSNALYSQSGKKIPRHDHLCSQELVGSSQFKPVRHKRLQHRKRWEIRGEETL